MEQNLKLNFQFKENNLLWIGYI